MVGAATPRRTVVPALLVVVVAVGLEVVALAAVVVVYLVGLVGSQAADALGAVVTAALAAAAGAGLALCARGLLGRRRWARAPILTWQLLQLLVALTFVSGPLRWPALVALLVAVAAAGGLLTPSAVAATREGIDPPV